MARTVKKAVKKPTKKKSRRTPKKRTSRLVSNRNQDTISVLDGPMKDAIREAFLNRP